MADRRRRRRRRAEAPRAKPNEDKHEIGVRVISNGRILSSWPRIEPPYIEHRDPGDESDHEER